MSTNNTVPFNWDSENDNALFGSLFPDGLSMPNFGDSFFENNSSSSKKRNALSYSPLSKNGSDVRDAFFGGSKNHKYDNFQIVVDSGCDFNPLEKIKVIEECFYDDTNNSGIYGDTISEVEDNYTFTVKLFISENKNELEALYNNPTIIPSDYEILLFLENNYGDWSGSTMYAKKGKNITENQFKGLTKSGENRDKKGYLHYLQEEYNISSSELIEFLETGVINNKFLDIISYLFKFTSLFVSNPVILNGVASGIETAVNFIKKECLIKDNDWNPSNKKDFKPFLFQQVTNALDTFDDDEINQFLKDGLANLKTHIDQSDATIEKLILGISKTPLVHFIPFVQTLKIPDTFSEFLLQKYRHLKNTIDIMLIDAENLDFSNMAKEAVYCINAFLCGVWNGFIEAVCGIISLIKYLFEGAAFLSDLLKNFKIKGPEILEKIDDITSAFYELDFGKIFANLVKSVKSFINSEHSVSLVEVSYFSGMFLGFVLELAVEIVGGILLTGGVLTVEAVFAKIGQTFKAIGSLIYGAMKLPVSLAGKTLTGFMQALHWLYEFLSKGTDEIVRIIDEVFDAFKAYGRESLSFANAQVPLLGKAEFELYKKLLKAFYKPFGKLLSKYAKPLLVTRKWKQLNPMGALEKKIIEELLELRKLNKKGFNKNAAILKAEVEVDGKIYEREYKALAGDGVNGRGLCENVNKNDLARELEMSNEELFKNYQALDIETNQLKPRFHDSENKMFSAFDDDILRLQANNAGKTIKVKSINIKTLFEPCNSCKKQIIIRHEMYNVEKLSVEAVIKNSKKYAKDNLDLKRLGIVKE